jgi:hypothetical protein
LPKVKIVNVGALQKTELGTKSVVCESATTGPTCKTVKGPHLDNTGPLNAVESGAPLSTPPLATSPPTHRYKCKKTRQVGGGGGRGAHSPAQV